MVVRHQIVLSATKCWFFFIYSPEKKKDTQSHARYSMTFTRINSPFFSWQFSCRYREKWRVVFLDFFVDKLRQLREFNTWKIIPVQSLKKKMYLYSFLLFLAAYDDSRFSGIKYYFSSVTASWRYRVTFTQPHLMLQTTKTHALKVDLSLFLMQWIGLTTLLLKQ